MLTCGLAHKNTSYATTAVYFNLPDVNVNYTYHLSLLAKSISMLSTFSSDLCSAKTQYIQDLYLESC